MPATYEELHPQLPLEEFLDGNSRIELVRWQPDEGRTFVPEDDNPAALQMVNRLYEKTGFRPSSDNDGPDMHQSALIIVADELSVLMAEMPLGTEDHSRAVVRQFQGSKGGYTATDTLHGRYLKSTMLSYNKNTTVVFGYKTTLTEPRLAHPSQLVSSEDTPLHGLYRALTDASVRKRGGGLLGILRR